MHSGVGIVDQRARASEHLFLIQLVLIGDGLLVMVDEEVRRTGEEVLRLAVDEGRQRVVGDEIAARDLPERVPDDKLGLQDVDLLHDISVGLQGTDVEERREEKVQIVHTMISERCPHTLLLDTRGHVCLDIHHRAGKGLVLA